MTKVSLIKTRTWKLQWRSILFAFNYRNLKGYGFLSWPNSAFTSFTQNLANEFLSKWSKNMRCIRLDKLQLFTTLPRDKKPVLFPRDFKNCPESELIRIYRQFRGFPKTREDNKEVMKLELGITGKQRQIKMLKVAPIVSLFGLLNDLQDWHDSKKGLIPNKIQRLNHFKQIIQHLKIVIHQKNWFYRKN